MLTLLETLNTTSMFMIGALSGAFVLSSIQILTNKRGNHARPQAKKTLDSGKYGDSIVVLTDISGKFVQPFEDLKRFNAKGPDSKLVDNIKHYLPALALRPSTQGPFTLLEPESKTRDYWNVHIKQLNPQRLEVSLLRICQRETPLFDNTTLSTLGQILFHMSHHNQKTLRQLTERHTQIENMLDFRTQRAQYLARELNLDPNNMEIYFSKYRLESLFEQLERARRSLSAGITHWSQPSAKPHTRSHIQLKAFIDQLAHKIQDSAAARVLSQIGLKAIILMPIEETEGALQLSLLNDHEVLLTHLCHFYELLALPTCDYQGFDGNQTPTELKLKAQMQNATLRLEFSDCIVSSAHCFTAMPQHLPSHAQEVSSVFTQGVTALLDLQKNFQISVTIAKKGAYGQACIEIPLGRAPVKPSQVRETPAMRDEPQSQELLTSLSEDIDYIKVKESRDTTIH